mgnify:CR=1 FL=1
MSGQYSTYKSRTRIERWFDARLPLPRLQKIARDAKDIADRISAAMRDGKPSRQGQFPIRKAQR